MQKAETIVKRASASAFGVRIERSRGWELPNLRDLWHYRELMSFLCWRDIKVRYKQTVLGILWAFVQPFTKLVVFSIIFGHLARVGSEGFPYPIFVYAGLLPWEYFAASLNRTSQSVVGNSNLISKVYFPRLIIPIAATGSGLVDFAISFLVLVGLMFYYGIAPGVQVLMVVPLLLLTLLAALGVGTFLSALNVAYRDFSYVVPFLIQTWMFLTPVIYPVTIFPDRWRWLIGLNPMTGLVGAWRAAILGGAFDWASLGVSVAITAAAFVVGALYFRRLERYFADII